MRAFTPEVERALRWFAWTHAIVIVPFVGARYERMSWPRAGGAGDQDAWLSEALEHLRLVHNTMLREQTSREPKKDRTSSRRGR